MPILLKTIIPIFTFFFALGHSQEETQKIIYLESSGEVSVLPDMANFTLEILCKDADIKISKSCLITKSNNLVKDLSAFKINNEDIHSSQINLSKNYEWVNNSNVFTGYSASINYEVTIKNIRLLDTVYTKLLDNKNLTIGQLTYGHSRFDSLSNLAMLKAIENGKKMAESILSALPEKKFEIVSISNTKSNKSDIGTNEPMMAKRSAQFNEADNTAAVRIGTMKIVEKMYLKFRIFGK